MLNRLLFELYKSPNNGKQLASLPDGRRVLLVHSEIAGPAMLRLMVARRATPQRIADFDDVGVLTGPGGVVPDAGPWGFGGSIVAVERTLHAAWTGPHGILYARATWAGDKFSWDRARHILEGDYWLGDFFVVGKQLALTYHQIHDRQNESVGVVWQTGMRWQVQELQRGRPMFAPVADVDGVGHIHFVWSDVAIELHYARMDKPGADPTLEPLGGGKQPTILVTGKQVLVVNEDEFGHVRYSFTDGQSWRRNIPLTMTSPWLTSDQIHSPGLTRDHHGVAWMFFADCTRRSTFWARWMGESWSDIYNGPRIYHRPPHFDFNLLSIGRLSVEKRSVAECMRLQTQSTNREVSRLGRYDIGMLLTSEAPDQQVEFRREVIPDLGADTGRKILFLDMCEFARATNVRLHVETAVKHPKNPLMEVGPKGAFDEDRVFNHGTVLLDDGKYRMWYGAIRELRRGEPYVPWYDWIKCGYAESDDGIHWKRVRLGLVEWNGSRENNIVPYLRHAPLVIKDNKDPDPRRRYKALYFWNFGEHLDMARTGKYGKQYDPRDERFLMDLFTSADGIHLERHEGEVQFPAEQAKPLSAIPNSAFRDDAESDPDKRYKAYGYMSLNLRRRGTCCLFSPDAQHWSAHPEMPVIDPAVRGIPPAAGGPTGQVHDTVCFRYEGYYLALYQDQREPDNMSIELAVSRDAETFRHVQVESKIIPVGPPGAFDARTIVPSMPVILDREIRLYYGGGTERQLPLDGRPKSVALPGLATLRRDGFTSIRLAADKRQGVLETIPFRLPRPATRLHLNVDCRAGSRLRAEVLDHTTGKTLPGYSLAGCNAITGDHLDTLVTWTRNAILPRTTKLVRLRLELEAGEVAPKLYAFWFN